jgi:hypothetical protein
VPIGVTPLYDDEDNTLIHEVTTLEDATYVAERGPGAHVKKLATNGRQIDFIIGAFLDATPIRFVSPTTDQRLDYHCHRRAGSHWLNIPPFVERDPDPPPANPGSYVDFVRSQANLPAPHLSYGEVTVEDIAQMTPETFLDNFSLWLDNHVGEELEP